MTWAIKNASTGRRYTAKVSPTMGTRWTVSDIASAIHPFGVHCGSVELDELALPESNAPVAATV